MQYRLIPHALHFRNGKCIGIGAEKTYMSAELIVVMLPIDTHGDIVLNLMGRTLQEINSHVRTVLWANPDIQLAG